MARWGRRPAAAPHHPDHDEGAEGEQEQPGQHDGKAGEHEGERVQQTLPRGIETTHDAAALDDGRGGRRPHRRRDLRHGGALLEVGELLGQGVEVGLAAGELALEHQQLLEVGRLGHQGAHPRDAVAGRVDAGLRVDVGGGHVLRLRRAVGDGAERRQLGEHAVELLGGDAEGEPRLVQADRRPAALGPVAGDAAVRLAASRPARCPTWRRRQGRPRVTTLSLSTVPPAPEAMMRARPAAPARSLTSRPIHAVRAIFGAVAAAAAASVADVPDVPEVPDPSLASGLDPAADPVGASGAAAPESFASGATEPSEPPEPAEPADEPASRWTTAGAPPTAAPRHPRRPRRGARARPARRGRSPRRRRGRWRGRDRGGGPRMVDDHATTAAVAGSGCSGRQGSRCSSWSSSGIPLAGGRWALLSHRSDQQTPGSSGTLQVRALRAGLRLVAGMGRVASSAGGCGTAFLVRPRSRRGGARMTQWSHAQEGGRHRWRHRRTGGRVGAGRTRRRRHGDGLRGRRPRRRQAAPRAGRRRPRRRRRRVGARPPAGGAHPLRGARGRPAAPPTRPRSARRSSRGAAAGRCPRAPSWGCPPTPSRCADCSPTTRWGASPTSPSTPLELDDVSVGDFVDARLGAAVTDKLVEPLLAGVYAGHARRISLDMAVPALSRAAHEGRSLLDVAREAQLAALSAPAAVLPVFATLVGGLGTLPPALRGRAAKRPASRCAPEPSCATCDPTVTAGSSRRGRRPTSSRERHDAVVVATPARPTSRLLADIAPDGGPTPRVGRVRVHGDRHARRRRSPRGAHRLERLPRAARRGPDDQGGHLQHVEVAVARRRPSGAHLAARLDRSPRRGGLPPARRRRRSSTPRSPTSGRSSASCPTRSTRTCSAGAGDCRSMPSGTVASWRSPGATLPPALALAGAAYDGVGIPACIASGRAAARALLTR